MTLPALHLWSIALIAPFVFLASGLYRFVYKYFSVSNLNQIARASAIYICILAAGTALFSFPSIPTSLLLMFGMMVLLSVSVSRIFLRSIFEHLYLNESQKANTTRRPAIIYGAGEAGYQLATVLEFSNEFKAIAFVDDSESKRGKQILGIPIFAAERLPVLIKELSIEAVLVAIPSAPKHRIQDVVRSMDTFGVTVRAIPGVVDLVAGRVTIKDLKTISIQDVLGREAASPDQDLMRKNIADHSVLVTGAGGSIGSEICRQALALNPTSLVLFELNEFALYAVHQELLQLQRRDGTSPIVTEIVPVLGNILDQEKLEKVIRRFKIDTLYHAAAYKHVPLVEFNPVEGIRNNVFGTHKTALAAAKSGVTSFVLISTDKAVRPTNTMGATKRLAEMILQSFAYEGFQDPRHMDGPKPFKKPMRISMVRFGNVLGSSGSVIPLFKRQIAMGGPITLTHRDITRYFMTIPEASQLVIQAGAMENKSETGGEVYVLDMGSPIKILDLARRMIDLAGLRVKDVASPFGDIEIKITGLRPGEKLFEELLIGDNVSATTHPLISCAEESYPNRLELEQGLLALSAAIDQQDSHAARVHLLCLVPSFTPTSKNADHLLDDNSPRQTSGNFATDKAAAKRISRSKRLSGIQFEHGKIQ